MPMLVMGQKTINSGKVSEFMNHVYVSTSSDPMAIIKAKQLKVNELQAQELISTTTTTTTLKSSKQKAAVTFETGPSVDTTYAYPWDANAQDWSTTQVARMIKTYDAQHNLILYQAYTRNPDTYEWMDSVKFTYTYNEANQVVNVIQQSWQFNGINAYSWVNVDNYINGYNALGQKTKVVYQYWNSENNNWDNNWQQELTYNADGLNTSILESQWSSVGNMWKPNINSISTYNTINQLAVNPIRVWDVNTNDWVNTFQYVYNYDIFGNNISMLMQTWNSGQNLWENSIQKTMVYNSSNKIDNYLFQLWDVFLYEWKDSQRGIYKYDSIGNNICIIGQDYDASSNTWNMSWQNIYDYNNLNKQISSASLYWDLSSGIWALGSKTKSFKIKLNNGSQQTITKNLKVYPNPAETTIIIETNSDINLVQMLNLSGQEVLLTKCCSPSIQIDVTNLKPGLYLINIKNSGGTTYKEKIIKR
jgi:hypothetical protein